jgi:hypothetical protein
MYSDSKKIFKNVSENVLFFQLPTSDVWKITTAEEAKQIWVYVNWDITLKNIHNILLFFNTYFQKCLRQFYIC